MTEHQPMSSQQLIQHIVQATNRLTDQEAAQRYQQILAQLPPDQATKLNALALSQVGHTTRRSLAGQFRQAHDSDSTPFDGYDFDDDDEAASPLGLGRMSVRAQHQDPALLGNLLGENSSLGGTIGKAALSALLALLIRQLLNNRQSGSSGQGMPAGGVSKTDPLSEILGGLLGGGGQSGGIGGQPLPGRSNADPLSEILGGLLGGGAQSQGQAGSQPAPGGLDIGTILDQVLNSDSSTSQAPQGGGLGSLLDAILGGTATSPAPRSHRR